VSSCFVTQFTGFTLHSTGIRWTPSAASQREILVRVIMTDETGTGEIIEPSPWSVRRKTSGIPADMQQGI